MTPPRHLGPGSVGRLHYERGFRRRQALARSDPYEDGIHTAALYGGPHFTGIYANLPTATIGFLQSYQQYRVQQARNQRRNVQRWCSRVRNAYVTERPCHIPTALQA